MTRFLAVMFSENGEYDDTEEEERCEVGEASSFCGTGELPSNGCFSKQTNFTSPVSKCKKRSRSVKEAVIYM